MRLLRPLVAMAIMSIPANAGGLPLDTLTPDQRSAFLQAATAYSKCVHTWLDTLGPSKDPVEIVTDTLMMQCNDELGAYSRALAPMFPAVSFSDFYNITLSGQKKFITSELVKRRVTSQTTTADKPKPFISN
jgi:hypothetical protein